ncbi:MAG: heme-binding protein [Pirellulaceae bacterium]|nr:heme-binding protein [Pirellulaceae bacterium]
MVWIFCTFLVLALAYLGWSTSRGGYESASYRTIESELSFEIREYPKLKLVTTPMNFDSQGNDGSFMRLFRFISGGNSKQQKVAMTTPVFMDQQQNDSAGRMAFVVPSQVASDGVPLPLDQDIEIKERQAGLFAVVRFAGRINEQTIRKQERELRQWMEARGVAGECELDVAGYDPPWIPGPLRRNEILVRIKPQTAVSGKRGQEPIRCIG